MKRIRHTAFTIAMCLGILILYHSCVPGTGSIEGNNDNNHSQIYLAEVVSGVYSNEAIPIDNLKVYRGINQEDTISLKNLAGNGVLIIRFSGEACTVCIDFALDMVKRVFPDYSRNERVVFLVSQIQDRLKEKYYGKPVYSFTDDELNLPFEQYHIPYFFILDQSMECKLFFIPEMSHPRLTEFYLSTIKARYFSSQKP